jgi:hypothetical protein
VTLTITVVTRQRIYQSADFRLINWNDGSYSDFETQKIIPFVKSEFVASVCFAGVGRVGEVDLGEWLDSLIANFPRNGSFDQFLEQLTSADEFLPRITDSQKRRHTFSVGAFVRTQPQFALVSNFERAHHQADIAAATHLTIHRINVGQGAHTFRDKRPAS